jgi:type IV pilus assembly protein PilW
MKHTNWSTHRFQQGISLVEIMVAFAIGLLVSLVVMQVFSTYDKQKKATSGNSDAQTNGGISLYMIQRDALNAGFGLPVFDTKNSPLKATSVIALPSLTNIDISPITIIDGGTSSDRLIIRYGNAQNGGIPITVIGSPTITNTPYPGNGTIGVSNNLGCQDKDTSLACGGTTCRMSTVYGPTDIAVPPVSTVPVPDTDHIKLLNVTGISDKDSLSCLGSWQEIEYRVNNNQLEQNTAPIMSNIVNLQAQYGVSSSPTNNQIDQWVNATGAWGTGISVANRNRIKAIRVAVVARNDTPDTEEVTAACSSTSDASPTGLCAWDATSASPPTASAAPSIDLTGDWKKYRYRVFETIIPLRSVIWSRATL